MPTPLSKYETVKTLGQGSYGKALLVRTRSTGNNKVTYFVMKEIQIGHLSNKEKQASVAEATVLAKMHHSNICSYVESFLNSPKNNILYIVMDYADGGDLSGAVERRKKQRRPFTEAEVMNVFVQLCLAMKHVHAQKILHRDLKAQNIFLTKKGVVKLGDFGIAKVLDSTGDVAKTQIGTPYYLSPEICEDKPYGKKSDIWSLGCVLYEIAALTLPFQARNLPALAHRIMTKSPEPLPASHRYSLQLQRLVSSLLNKKPENRPSIVNILKSEYVQNHIQSLLSHTIKSGTGGMEGDANLRDKNKMQNAAGARPNPTPFTPKLPEKRNNNNIMKKFKKENMEANAAQEEKKKLVEREREREKRDAQQQSDFRQKSAIERLKSEKEEALREHARMEQKLRNERDMRAKEREREAKRKLRLDADRRKMDDFEEQQLRKFREQQREMQDHQQQQQQQQQQQYSTSNDDIGDPPPKKRSPPKPVSLKDWVSNKNNSEDAGPYEGRDGWMYKEQSALEQDIEVAKRVYEGKIKEKNRQEELHMRAQSKHQQHVQNVMQNVQGFGGGGGGNNNGGVWEAKREAAALNMQQQQFQQQQVGNYNNGQFANPQMEWGWSRAQAEKNRIRAEHDLNRGAAGKNSHQNHNNHNQNMKAEIEEMNARTERERASMNQQQARMEFFNNRQVAAAAKARYQDENNGQNNNFNGNRGRRSSVEEVRKSANLQKEVEDAKKKQEFDEAYRLMQEERAALAQKLQMRKEEEKSEFKQIDESKDEEGSIASSVEDEDVNQLAQALEQAADCANEESDDDDDEIDDDADMMVNVGHSLLSKASIRTAIELNGGGNFNNMDEVNEYMSSDEEIIFTPSKKKQNNILISPVKRREEGGPGGENKEEVEEVLPDIFKGGNKDKDGEQITDELVKTLHKMNSGEIVFDEDGEDFLMIGGGKGVLMNERNIDKDKDWGRDRDREAKEVETPPRIFSSPPSGVAMEIDMSPASSKISEKAIEKKREILRMKQEARMREREEVRRSKEHNLKIEKERERERENESESVRNNMQVAKVVQRRISQGKKPGWKTGDVGTKNKLFEALRRKVVVDSTPPKKKIEKKEKEGINTLCRKLDQMKIDLRGKGASKGQGEEKGEAKEQGESRSDVNWLQRAKERRTSQESRRQNTNL